MKRTLCLLAASITVLSACSGSSGNEAVRPSVMAEEQSAPPTADSSAQSTPATVAQAPISTAAFPGEPVPAQAGPDPQATASSVTPAASAGDQAALPSPPKTDLCPLLASLSSTWTEAGRSVEGQPLLLRRFPGNGPTVLWVGGIHGDEPEGKLGTEEIPRVLAEAGVQQLNLVQLQDANPDGRAANNRLNANGVDLNRNFPTKDFDPKTKKYGESPLSQPESRLLHDLIDATAPSAILVMHSWKGRSFVNYDGPAEALAKVWSEKSSMELVASDGLGRTTPGSLGTWAGVEGGIPILTVEYLNGEGPEKAWDRSETAAVETIRAAQSLPPRKSPCG